MYLLDTDIIIWILRRGRGSPQILEAIESILTRLPQNTIVSAITIAEVYKNMRDSELVLTEEFLGQQTVVPVSSGIAKLAGLYWRDFHPQIPLLGLSDCIIAATAKDQEIQLFTLNTKHFPMKDIEVLDPTKIG